MLGRSVFTCIRWRRVKIIVPHELKRPVRANRPDCMQSVRCCFRAGLILTRQGRTSFCACANRCSAPRKQRACGRPRRSPVAAVLPHWSRDDGRLPDGRLTRLLPQSAEGHRRNAWCEHRSGTAFTRPTVIVFGSARARAYGVGHNSKAGWRGPLVRHADTHPQADTLRSRVRTPRTFIA